MTRGIPNSISKKNTINETTSFAIGSVLLHAELAKCDIDYVCISNSEVSWIGVDIKVLILSVLASEHC